MQSALAADIEVPGVDVVVNAADRERQAALLTTEVRSLIGALHRRFWSRRREVLHQTTAGPSAGERGAVFGKDDPSTWTVDEFEPPAALRWTMVGGAGDDAWDDRITEIAALVEGFKEPVEPGAPLDIVGVRGWCTTEPAVLVDGRATPGNIFDLAVVTQHAARPLREGASPFWIAIPELGTPCEAQLWCDLLTLAEDRLGVERGTIRTVATVETSNGMRGLDAVLSELRDRAVGVAVATGSGVDEVDVKDAATRRGAMYAGVIAGR